MSRPAEENAHKASNRSLQTVSPDTIEHKTEPKNAQQHLSSHKTLEFPATSNQNPKVSEMFTQLQNYLDNLSGKFNEVKEKHQADFLIAYRNHMTKVKRELQELKQKSEDQERQMNQNDRLSNMEKQLTWFREESIKLYQKVEGKNKENYELKFRIQELEKEKTFLESQVKALLKKNRLLEVYLYNNSTENEKKRGESVDALPREAQAEIDNTFYTASHNYDRIKSKIRSRIDEEGQGLYTSHHFSQLQAIVSKYLPAEQDATGVTLELTSYVRIIESQREKLTRQLQTKLQAVVKQSTKTNMVRSDLENFFLDCVETVRRQIMKRKPPQHRDPQRLIKEFKDYAQFRTEDKLKVLELLLTHEKLLVFLYQKIFPSNFSTYVQTFTNGLGGAAFTNEQAADVVARSFQEKSAQLVHDGFEDYQPSGDISQNIRIQSGSFHLANQVPPPLKGIRSNSVKVSEKLMVKKGKLIFKPF